MSQRRNADKFDRLDKARRVASKLMCLMDPDVQSFLDDHEASLLRKTLESAGKSDHEALRTAALELKAWRDMRDFIKGSVNNLTRIDAALEEMRKSQEAGQ